MSAQKILLISPPKIYRISIEIRDSNSNKSILDKWNIWNNLVKKKKNLTPKDAYIEKISSNRIFLTKKINIEKMDI